MQTEKPTIDPQIIKIIESVLAAGKRVELIPVENGVRIYEIKRKEIKGGGNHE